MPESFLIKLQAEACNFMKKEALTWVFSCEFCEITEQPRATGSGGFIAIWRHCKWRGKNEFLIVFERGKEFQG